MKLKKIASLALAGIMAVSMLAGCKDNPSSSSEPTTPPETVTGAAAAINAELDNNKNQISFESNSVIESYLTDYYTNNPITSTYADGRGTTINDAKLAPADSLATSVKTLIDAQNANISGGNNANGWANRLVLNSFNTKEVTNVELYIFNAEKMTEAGALKMVGQHLDDLTLPKEGVDVNGSDASEKNYSYTGSVAAVKAESAGKTAAAWVIAVTITQTPSAK